MGPAFEGALESGLSVVIGVLAGYYADRFLGTERYHPFLFVLMILGGVAGVRRLMQIPWPGPPSNAPDPGAARDAEEAHDRGAPDPDRSSRDSDRDPEDAD